ncbi:MAG: hypothetical protein JWM44_2027 [Bacilli bacterium]|jgi:hypothetical protein|nr:hypothetical protein [Bacilli bacterium]
MSKNYLELQKYFPELFEKKENLSAIFISAPVEDFKAKSQIDKVEVAGSLFKSP